MPTQPAHLYGNLNRTTLTAAASADTLGHSYAFGNHHHESRIQFLLTSCVADASQSVLAAEQSRWSFATQQTHSSEVNNQPKVDGMAFAARPSVQLEGSPQREFGEDTDSVIPGWKNRLMTSSTSLLPRSFTRKLVGKMQAQKPE